MKKTKQLNFLEVKKWLDSHAPKYEIPTQLLATKICKWELIPEDHDDFPGCLKGSEDATHGMKTLHSFKPFHSLDDANIVINKLGNKGIELQYSTSQ